jgi:hypothetical protein
MFDLPFWLPLIFHRSATLRTSLPFDRLPQPVLPGQRLQHLRHDRSSPWRDLCRYLVKTRLRMRLAPLPQLIIYLAYRLL